MNRYADALNNRGVVRHDKGKYDEAIADYTLAIDCTRKNDPTRYVNRGNSYGAKGDYDKAIDDFSEAIRLNPKFAKALYFRGIANEKNGDDIGAELDLAEAKKLGFNPPKKLDFK